MKKSILFLTICFLTLASNLLLAQNQKSSKPRTIVTTDGELDDVDSFIRLLLYSNEFSIEGLIISSSQWHYKGDGKGTKFTSEMEMTKKMYGERTELRWPGTQWIYNLVDAYGKVYPSLKTNAAGYPSAQHLKSLIRIGNIDFEGEMEKDTEGSDYIKKKLLDDDMTPLYLQVWGGTNTIARALKSIEDDYKNTPKWQSIYEKVCKKAIIYAILDQDATYRKYISVNWKDIKIYYNSKQFWCLAYFWKTAVPIELHPFLEGKFMGEKIINNHGALTKMYYSYGDGNPPAGEIEDIYSDPAKIKKNQWGSFGQYDFISEGDSPAFLHLVNVGLGNLENPQFGGWGGRLVQSKTSPNRWEDGENAADFNTFTKKTDLAFAQTRWLEVLQNDFASRADWCIKNYKNANHPPIVKLNIPANLTAAPNSIVKLNGTATDPDGNTLSYHWWQYEEVDTYNGKISIENADKKKASFKVPSDIKKGETIHLILEVKDNGTPQLTRYQRVIVSIK
ncbi:nucleoside hydrolase-like domain-containing protein [Emticicia sp. SJ17W-69]|uniref:DUF1593 domain-containing protein n=1 Tax=Emticicia sp. SJ17W-69 TaxID=3421657 RepID=UPI003EB949D3